MKQLTKYIMLLMMLVVLSPAAVHAAEGELSPPVVEEEVDSNATISPRTNEFGWKYMYVDGVAYRRLYNYRTGEWVGSWMRC